ncbi:MAG TPA: glycosyltransferase, partial [Planctomycetota bacterium]|nr:glycosyltransferase [Planctomycetota bacterium]
EPFCNEMHELYRTADFVVARSGATTLAELTALGLPMALIPFPQAMDDHQTFNALSLVKSGAALLWPQADLTPERFTERLVAAVSDRGSLENMKNASRNCGVPDSGLRILARIADIVNGVHAAGEQKTA